MLLCPPEMIKLKNGGFNSGCDRKFAAMCALMWLTAIKGFLAAKASPLA